MQSKADLQTNDSLKFHIACGVVDIRPNGNLVLEGQPHDQQQRRDLGLLADRRDPRPTPSCPTTPCSATTWPTCGSSSTRRGHVRDGYRRGWLLDGSTSGSRSRDGDCFRLEIRIAMANAVRNAPRMWMRAACGFAGKDHRRCRARFPRVPRPGLILAARRCRRPGARQPPPRRT